MGVPSVKQRLWDILNAISVIREIISGKTIFDYTKNNEMRWAIERGIGIISEASRHIPESMKAQSEDTPWRHVADIGSVLRYEYHHVDDEIMYIIALDDLPKLESFIKAQYEQLKDPS